MAEIRSLGTEMEASIVVEKLLNVVLNKFLSLVSTIEQWGNISSMSVAEAVGQLRIYEENKIKNHRHNREGEPAPFTQAQWEALSVTEKRMMKGLISHNRQGYAKKPYRKFDKSKVKCFNCSKYGHFALEFCEPKKERALVAEKEE